MRKSMSSKPLGSNGSKHRKHGEGNPPNYSATRNTKRVGNPIAVPGNPPRDFASNTIVAKMKNSRDSNPQGIVGSSGHMSVSGERGRKRKISNTDLQPKHIPNTRSSSRTQVNKRKESEVIEIDSDNEESFHSGEETPRPTVRKRRLVQEDIDSDEEEHTPFDIEKKKMSEPSDTMCQKVTSKLVKDRKAIQEAKRRARLEREEEEKEQHRSKLFIEKEKSNAELDRTLELVTQTLVEEERNQAIVRERERIMKLNNGLESVIRPRSSIQNSLQSSSFTEKNKGDIPNTFVEKELRIPSRRINNNNNNSLRNSFEEKIPTKPTPISLSQSASKTSSYFNLPTTTYKDPASTKATSFSSTQRPRSKMDSLKSLVRSTRNLIFPNKSTEEAIQSKPIVGDVFEYKVDDDFKLADTPLKTAKVIDTASKKTKLDKAQEAIKIELPYDAIDDDPLQPIGSDNHLLTYPFDGRKSVTVYERDLTRLDEDQYLNDTLLDVFPKIWEDDYLSGTTHTFSSFFYTKLAGDGSSVNYDKIGRWTANINIFEKKTIIIPVAQYHHWYLVVVTNPGRCIKDAKSYGLLKDDESDEESVEEERPPRVGRWKNQVPAGARLNPKKAYIMILDSLGGTKKETCTNTSEYLKKEAMQKLNIQEDEFVEPEFVSAHCPNQKNFVDCGVFCLHFINSLYKDPQRMMKVLYNHQKDDKGWDLENTLPVYRQVLRRILKKKMVKYREYLTGKLKEESGYV